MINKERIESILEVNGVNKGSNDEEIRSVLLSARYSEDEVNTAIMVLRENTQTHKTRVDGLHKVFRSGEALSPEEISQLLGIEVEFDTRIDTQTTPEQLYGWQTAFVWILSVVIGVGGVLLYMYLNQVGPFHPAF